MSKILHMSTCAAIGLALGFGAAVAQAAGPEVVSGPGADPECFTPYSRIPSTSSIP